MTPDEMNLASNMSKLSARVKVRVDELNAEMKKKGFDKAIATGFKVESTLSLIQDNSSFKSEMSDLIISAKELADYVSQFVINENGKRELEGLRIEQEFKLQQAHAYKAWGHKIVRWAVGIVIAVILYSTAVYISERCTFIKIPVRDLIKKPEISAPQ